MRISQIRKYLLERPVRPLLLPSEKIGQKDDLAIHRLNKLQNLPRTFLNFEDIVSIILQSSHLVFPPTPGGGFGTAVVYWHRSGSE